MDMYELDGIVWLWTIMELYEFVWTVMDLYEFVWSVIDCLLDQIFYVKYFC
jgi:hypothetical protein